MDHPIVVHLNGREYRVYGSVVRTVCTAPNNRREPWERILFGDTAVKRQVLRAAETTRARLQGHASPEAPARTATPVLSRRERW
jgi:hypothetical protein